MAHVEIRVRTLIHVFALSRGNVELISISTSAQVQEGQLIPVNEAHKVRVELLTLREDGCVRSRVVPGRSWKVRSAGVNFCGAIRAGVLPEAALIALLACHQGPVSVGGSDACASGAVHWGSI